MKKQNNIPVISLNDRLSISELIKEQDLSASSIKSYNIGISHFWDWVQCVLKKDATDLTVYDYIAYKKYLGSQNYSNNTKNSYLVAVLAMYKILEKHGVDNICSGVRLFDTNKENLKEGVNIEDWQKVLSLINDKKFNGKKHYVIMYLLFVSGVRQMSLRNLKWGDFGYDAKVGSMVMEVKLKGRGNRREKVLLNEEAVKLIQEYQFMYVKHYAMDFCGELGEINKDWYVFGNKDRILKDSSIRKITTEWLKKAGVYRIGEVTPHSLRHGIAELLIDRGLEVKAVQQFLCHKNISSTMIYAGRKEKLRVDKQLLGEINTISFMDLKRCN